jgi:hypothetical protein
VETTRLKRSLLILPAAGLTAALPLLALTSASPSAATPTVAGASVVADTYADSAYPTQNFGSVTTVRADAAASSGQIAYVTFRVAGLTAPAASATLRMYSESTGRMPTSVSGVSSAWGESSLDWANRPALGAPIGVSGPLAQGSWVTVDVTPAVQGDGLVSFALTTGATASRLLGSREGGQPPQLLITAQQGTTSAPPTSAPPTSAPPTSSDTTVVPTVSPTATSASPSPTSTPPPATATKVLTIVEENHNLAQMSSGLPYLFGLAQRFSYANGYTAITHPSEPNYLAIAGGSTFGDTTDHNPAFQVHGSSIFGQALAAGKTARLYAESMTTPCQQNSSGNYAVKHNPWASFADERAQCQAGDLPMGGVGSGALATDIAAGRLPDAGIMVPNMCNDAHDCALSTANTWLAQWLPAILAGSDYTSGRLVVVVTGDEDDRNGGNKVLTVVLHRSLDGAHRVVSSALTHYSLTGLYDAVVGTPKLGAAATAPDMRSAFQLH